MREKDKKTKSSNDMGCSGGDVVGAAAMDSVLPQGYRSTETGEKFGYIRISMKEQNADRQIIALEPYGIPKRNIYLDEQSGKDFERLKYKRMLKRLKAGDVLFIKSIDRLGRNYDEIIEQLEVNDEGEGCGY